MEQSTDPWKARAEPWFFGALVLLHALPVVAFMWFPTLDGPAHLYNARIINSLLHGDAATARFFELNPFPEPNWLGHAIMAGVLVLSSPQAAEKIVMLCYVLGTPLAFRFAIRRLGAATTWPALLIFPFIYCFTFRIGFVNFSLGLPLLLLALGTGVRLQAGAGKRPLIALGVLLTLLFFAHLTSFLLGVGLLLASAMARSSGNAGLRGWLRACQVQLIAAIPGLVLCVAFFLAHADARVELKRLPFEDVLTGLLNGRPFVSLSDTETPYARAMAWGMMALALSAVLLPGHRNSGGPSRHWLPLSLAVVTVSCFILPDQMATGGFITIRLMLFTYLLGGLWLALHWSPGWWNAVLLGMILTADLLLLRRHYTYTEDLNAELAEVTSVAAAVPEHAVIVPLNYSGNWLHSNWPCYLGSLRNTEILDNFGARTAHMPVRWRGGMDPSEGVGTFATSDRPCVDLNVPDTGNIDLIDHVLTFKLRDDIVDSCTNAVRAQLSASFVEVAVSPHGDARLYRRK